MATKKQQPKPGDPLPKGMYWRGDTIWVRHQVNGVNKRTSTHGQSVTDAEILLSRLRADAAAGKFDEAIGKKKAAPTLEALILKYLPEWETKSSYVDVKRYAMEWQKALGGFRADQIQAGDIKKHLAKIQKERSYSPAAVNRRRAFISALYRKAMRDELLEKNPAFRVEKQEEVQRVRYLDPKTEAPKLQAKMKPHQWDLVLIAVWTGLRKGALLRLKVADVDLKGGVLKIETLAGRKKAPRLVPLVGEALEAAERQVERSNTLGSPWLFPGRNRQEPLSAKAAHQLLVRAAERAKIPDFRFHDLRHSTGSLLAQAGVSAITIQEILAHSSAAMTKRYSHTAIEHRREALKQLPRLSTEQTPEKHKSSTRPKSTRRKSTATKE